MGLVARSVLRQHIFVLRQPIITEYDPGHGAIISTLSYEYPRAFHVQEHAHGCDQLIYAIRGVMQVSVGRCAWLIPPHFGMWIPARIPHSIKMPEVVSMRTLYLRRRLSARLPATCTVIHIPPLLRELILETVRLRELRTRDRLHCAVRDLLLSNLESASVMETSLTLPQDPRARAVADKVISSLAERQPLADICASVGASVRTIQRIFRREVGSDFKSWRRQARLLKAIELLVGGQPVKEVGYALGYRQPTAFVEMFRGILGATPGAWLKTLRPVR